MVLSYSGSFCIAYEFAESNVPFAVVTTEWVVESVSKVFFAATMKLIIQNPIKANSCDTFPLYVSLVGMLSKTSRK